MNTLIEKMLLEESLEGSLSKVEEAGKGLNSFEVIVDVDTPLNADKLKDFIGRVIGYANARGHKMTIINVVKTE